MNNNSNFMLGFNLFRLFIRAVGKVFEYARLGRNTLFWGLAFWIAVNNSVALVALVIVFAALTLVLATTDLFEKVPQFEGLTPQVKAQIKTVARNVAPFLADKARITEIRNYRESVVYADSLLENSGLVDRNSNQVYALAASQDENGNTVFYRTRKTTLSVGLRKYKLQRLARNATELAGMLEPALGYFDAAYAEADDNFKNKYYKGRVVMQSANVSQELRRGNDMIKLAGIVQTGDTNFYPVMSHVINGGINIEISAPISERSPAEVINMLTEARDKFDMKYVRNVTDGSGNWVELEFFSSLDPAVNAAHDLLHEAGVLQPSDANIYDVSLTSNEDEVIFKVNKAIRSVTNMNIIRAIEQYKERFNARGVRHRDLGDGKLEVTFVITDFLDKSKTINFVPSLDENDMSVVCATNAFGEDVKVAFKETPGMLIAGIPGSGKTAGATTFLTPLAASPDVELSVIDGKGGSDWDSYAPLSHAYIKGADTENLEEIAELLESFVASMNDRLANQKDALGVSNFWNASPEVRRAAGLKFRLLIIDECQDLFNINDRKIQARVEDSLGKLVRKGRSAGVSVVFITQKTTTDSIPSSIRDNCALRIAFRLLTPAAKIAILGENSEMEGAPSPLDIPAHRKGGAVMATETGELTAVRFFYIPEEDLNLKLDEVAANLRKSNQVTQANTVLSMVEDNDVSDEDRAEAEAAAARIIAARSVNPVQEAPRDNKYHVALPDFNLPENK